MRIRLGRFGFKPAYPAQLGEIRTDEHEQSGDEDGFGHPAFDIGCRLERFARLLGEAVQVQAVVPVRASDQRQAMGPEIFDDMVEGTFQMLEQRSGVVGVAVERNLLVKDAQIAGFFNISGRAENEPKRVVVKTAADLVVAFLVSG